MKMSLQFYCGIVFFSHSHVVFIWNVEFTLWRAALPFADRAAQVEYVRTSAGISDVANEDDDVRIRTNAFLFLVLRQRLLSFCFL